MFDPKIGQFLSEDYLGLFDDINPRRYVKNDPLDRTDPSGLDSIGLNISPNGGPISYIYRDFPTWLSSNPFRWNVREFDAGVGYNGVIKHKGRFYFRDSLEQAATQNTVDSQVDFDSWVATAKDDYDHFRMVVNVAAKIAKDLNSPGVVSTSDRQDAGCILNAIITKYAPTAIRTAPPLSSRVLSFAKDWPTPMNLVERSLDYAVALQDHLYSDAAKGVNHLFIQPLAMAQIRSDLKDMFPRLSEVDSAWSEIKDKLSIADEVSQFVQTELKENTSGAQTLSQLGNILGVANNLSYGSAYSVGPYFNYLYEGVQAASRGLAKIEAAGMKKNYEAIMDSFYDTPIVKLPSLPFGIKWAQDILKESK